MWFREIKRKKRQYLGIALILIFATSILVGCAAFVTEANSSTEKYYEDCMDYQIYTSEGNSERELSAAIQENKKISSVAKYDAGAIKGNIEINGKSITPFYTYLGVMEDYHTVPYPLNIYEGTNQKAPAEGTIWLSKVYADDKKIHVGDTMKVSNHDFRVSAIFRTAMEPNSLNQVFTFFCNERDYQIVKPNLTALKAFYLKADNMTEEQITAFVTNSISDFANNVPIYTGADSVKGNVNTLITLVGGIGLLAAVLVFCAAIAIIQFIIKNNLTEEYRTIGIHKALGDTNRIIRGIYIKSYMFVGFISIVIGSLLGIPLSRYLNGTVSKNITDPSITAITGLTTVVSILAMLGILYLNLRKTLRRISKITSVEAIRLGLTSSSRKQKKSLIANANSSFAMAVNDIFKRKGNSFMMLFLLTLSIFLSLFFINMNYSANNMESQPNRWFAIPKTSATISGDVTKELDEYIRSHKLVKDINASSLFNSFDVKPVDKNDPLDYSILTEPICENWEESTTQIKTTTGRPPRNENELMMGANALAQSGRNVGDYIKIKLNGKAHSFLITGSYSTMMNNSQSLAFNKDIFKLMDDNEYPYSLLFVNLKNESDFNTLKNDINARFKNVAVEKIYGSIASSAKGISTIVKPVTTVLVLIFVLFSIMIIVNLLEMENLKNKRQYGILKALGRSNGYLCRRMLIKVMILSILALAFGTILNQLVSPRFFAMAIGVDGYLISTSYTIATLGLILGVVLLTTAGFCVPLRKVSPKQLMDE